MLFHYVIFPTPYGYKSTHFDVLHIQHLMLNIGHDNVLTAQHQLLTRNSSHVDHVFTNKSLYRTKICTNIQCRNIQILVLHHPDVFGGKNFSSRNVLSKFHC
jgi:hypothetical protein